MPAFNINTQDSTMVKWIGKDIREEGRTNFELETFPRYAFQETYRT